MPDPNGLPAAAAIFIPAKQDRQTSPVPPNQKSTIINRQFSRVDACLME
jgi:hypothetical protein